MTSCGETVEPTPAGIEALLEAGSLEEAAAQTRALIADRPNDASLRVLFGRIHLARSDGAAAQAAFERAETLGARDAELRGWLARSFELQGQHRQVLSVLPPSLDRSALGTELIDLRLRALLRIPLAAPRDIFLDARERLVRDGAAAAASMDALISESDFLEPNAAHVKRAIEHWECQQGEDIPVPTQALYQPHWANLSEIGRRVLRVGPTRELRAPSAAARIAQDGDIVEIDAGVYQEDVAVWKANGLWIRAVTGKAVLDSAGTTAEDMGIWVIRGNNAIVEGIRFVGARASNKNGSGIRLLIDNVWVRHSEFHDNETGLLTLGRPQGEVIVEHSVFTENGAGDGQSHNVYVGTRDRLIFRFNYSTGSRIGHQLKSRALENHILYNRLADESDGTSSYTIDLPQGGYALVLGNELQQGPSTVNRHMVSLGAEDSSGREHRFVFAYNTFYNHTFPATLIRDATGAGVVLVNNISAGAPASIDALIGFEAGNAWNASASLADGRSGDYRLVPSAPLIDAGANVVVADIPASPPFEYVHPAGVARRPLVWEPDPGAHEFCGWPD